MGDGGEGEGESDRVRASKREAGEKKGEVGEKNNNTGERYEPPSEVIATHRCLSSQNEDYD